MFRPCAVHAVDRSVGTVISSGPMAGPQDNGPDGSMGQGQAKPMTDESWNDVKTALKSAVGTNNFTNWIEPLNFGGVDGGVATFYAPTRFLGDYAGRTYGDMIEFQLRKHGQTVERLSFQVRSRGPAADDAQRRTAPAPRPAAARELEAVLKPHLNFDTFVVGKPNELAFAAAKRVAESTDVVFNPLYFHGGSGLGKTHLMHAIGQSFKARHPDRTVLYISAEEFMNRFVAALRSRSMMDFKSLFRSVDLLMIDDVQFLAGKDSTQEEFFHTFNALVDAHKQLVISADCPPSEIGLEDRISSRLQCGLVVDIHPTDFELRLGILQNKVAELAPPSSGIVFADGVLDYIAHRVSTNVRVLEGALHRLIAVGSLTRVEITIEIAQDNLADILSATNRKVTIEDIQRRVADHFNIKLSDLLGPKRFRIFARPRQVAMYLSKMLTNRSYPEIGRVFGKRDHTTVLHGVRRIEALMAGDAELADEVQRLRRAIEG